MAWLSHRVGAGFHGSGRAVPLAEMGTCWSAGVREGLEDGLVDGVGDAHADRARQPSAPLGEPGCERVCSARGVGTDQCLASAPVLLRRLLQGEFGCGDVVGGGITASFPGLSRPTTGFPL